MRFASTPSCATQKTTQNKLLMTEMDFWRRAAQVSRRDKIRNNKIAEIMRVRHIILDDITLKQLRCGHMKRMQEDRLPKKCI